MTMLSDHGVGGVTDNYGIYLANTLYRNRRLNALASSVQSYSKLYMTCNNRSRAESLSGNSILLILTIAIKRQETYQGERHLDKLIFLFDTSPGFGIYMTHCNLAFIATVKRS